MFVKSFGSTFHTLADLVRNDFWNVNVLHLLVVNSKHSGSADLVVLSRF